MPTNEADTSLIYVGIDEAGYGPTLGPLTTAMTVFRINGWSEGQRAPNLWSSLRRVIGRTASDARSGKLPINDSKQLKLPNTSAKRHPLTHLERGVLAFLATMDGASPDPPATDQDLLEQLGSAPPQLPWYTGDAVDLPLSTTPDHLRLLGSQLSAACHRRGIELLAIRARILPEDLFNQRLETMHSKARVSFSLIEDLLRGLLDLDVGENVAGVRIVIDRQGGRTAYSEPLRRAFQDGQVHIVSERPDASTYDIRLPASAGWPDARLRTLFTVDAEAHHLPVALASMTAKLTRELAMTRFNRYFESRQCEVKPTAGYATDARRWLRDMKDVLSADERRLLVRRA